MRATCDMPTIPCDTYYRKFEIEFKIETRETYAKNFTGWFQCKSYKITLCVNIGGRSLGSEWEQNECIQTEDRGKNVM